MAIINPPAWLQAGTYNARADRLGVGSLLDVPGVTAIGGYAVTQTLTPSMSVLVSAGSAYVLNTYSAAQGFYVVVNDASVSVPLDASHPNFGRIDLIILRVYDAQYAGTTNLAQIEKVTGDASLSPAAPALPDNSIILASVLVPALGSSISNTNISTSLRQYAKLKSSLVDVNRVVTSTTRPSSPYVGQTIFETDSQASRIWTGTTWRVTSPGTAQTTLSTSRPAGGQVWPGMMILETDTLRTYMWDGVTWSYRGGGNGEFVTNTFTAWNPIYSTVFGKAVNYMQPLTLWKDAEGRYNLEGMITNAQPIYNWGIYSQYGICYLPAGTYPKYDIRVTSYLVAPNQGNDSIHIYLKGTSGIGIAPGSLSAAPGSPGIIMWQAQNSRSWPIPVGNLQLQIPRISWES